MSRMNHGPLTKTKGKLGGVVFQQYEGMQVAREYQPVVKNPQSTKQVENRAKFKLSSQIVAQFKEVISARLGKISNYERIRRGAAINAIYGIVDDSTPDNPQALINSVVASINAKNVSGYGGPLVQNYDTTHFPISADEGATVIAIGCGYNTKGELTGRVFETYEATASDHNLEITGEKVCVAMAVQIYALTDSGRASISNASNNGTAWLNEISRSIAAGDIYISNITSNTKIFA